MESRTRHTSFRLWLVIAAVVSGCLGADELTIAVASNFSQPATVLADRFEASSNHRMRLVFGSTGKHFAQIANGAPFDVFLAADVERPRLLEERGLAVGGTRLTYAVGRLVLWSPRPGLIDDEGEVLRRGAFRFLSIANPRLAPYGRAAREVLDSLELWEALRSKLVMGENINQTMHFVRSGGAELGLVAWSQVVAAGSDQAQVRPGSYWEVPPKLYQPIEQQAVIVRDSRAAREFLLHLGTSASRELIVGYGYRVP